MTLRIGHSELDTQHDDTQNNKTQNNNLKKTQIWKFSIAKLNTLNTLCHYAECRK
jgi:hypothetical protein